jgi:hypothetical protein
MMERRIRGLEQRFGPAPDPGQLAIIAPNSWSDQDQALWQRAEILHDTDRQDDLIEANSGIRPTRRPGRVSVVIVPAPDSVEHADEATRAAWREARRRDAWKDA